jgi:hypothetical protein
MGKKAYSIAKVVNDYSDPEVTDNVGKHLQDLIWYELRAQHFKVVGSNTNKYRGTKWTVSDFDLDHVAEHESGRLNIGLEAKNTLAIMSRKEIDEKIAICKHLNITPVFAVRWIKPYIQYIKDKGGFCWVFKTQMYPRPYQRMASEIFTRLSVPDRHDSTGHKLEFPVSVAGRLPELSVKNFKRWVSRKVKGEGA